MDEIMMFFKLNIGITSDAKKPLFEARIRAAIQELARKGIKISEIDVDDQMLVADLAAWMHEKRNSGEPIPMHIKERISDRKVKARCNTDA
ncbi:MAG: hypothetical protein IJA02_08905 [Clostridia bacterium]|nr:hypothetical protein [Clostridia bacterium]